VGLPAQATGCRTRTGTSATTPTATTSPASNWGTALDEVYTISPTLILDVRANWTRFHETNNSPANGIDPASVGFPYLKQYSQFVGLPYMAIRQWLRRQTHWPSNASAMTGDNDSPYDVFQIFTSLVKIRAITA